ncbi:MAG: hypothetical protein Q4P20_12630 [Eubacteriales bacterium]|nr:hypothetical protein [Eubacteriales bacterium]
MKKLIASIAAVAMALTMSLSAFALPSPTVSGLVKGVSTAVDKNGRSVDIIVRSIPDMEGSLSAGEKTAIEEIKDKQKLRTIMGSDWEDGMQLADIRYIQLSGDASLVSFPVTITFDIPGVTANSKVKILVFNKETGKWEVLGGKVSNGKVTATFEYLGLVAFVVDTDTAKAMESTVTSPKTGQSDFPIYAEIAVAVVLGGAILWVYRKGNTLSE